MMTLAFPDQNVETEFAPLVILIHCSNIANGHHSEILILEHLSNKLPKSALVWSMFL